MGTSVGKRCRKIGLYLLVAYISSIWSCFTQAAVCDRITVSASHNWFPVALDLSEDRSGSSGIAIEILRQIAIELSVSLDYQTHLPWKRALKYMDEGKVDVLTGHYNNSQRELNWLVSDPLIYDDIRAFIHVEHSNEIKQKADLYDLFGLYPAGASYGDVLDDFISNKVNASAFKNNSAMIGALIKKRFDFAIIAKSDGEALVAKLGVQELVKMSDFSLGTNSIHFSFSKKSPCRALFEKFNALIPKFNSDENIQKLTKLAFDKYFTDVIKK